MDFIFSTQFDWIMAAILIVLTIILNIPVGDGLIDSLTPKDKFNNKRTLKGDDRRRYRRILTIFFGGLGLIEASAAAIIPVWPYYAIPYMILIVADLLWFAFANKKI